MQIRLGVKDTVRDRIMLLRSCEALLWLHCCQTVTRLGRQQHLDLAEVLLALVAHNSQVAMHSCHMSLHVSSHAHTHNYSKADWSGWTLGEGNGEREREREREIERERERRTDGQTTRHGEKQRERERATETVSYQRATPRSLNIVKTFLLELECGREKLG